MNFVKHPSTTKYHQEQHYCVFFGTRFLKFKDIKLNMAGGGVIRWTSVAAEFEKTVTFLLWSMETTPIYPIPSMYGRYNIQYKDGMGGTKRQCFVRLVRHELPITNILEVV